MPSAKTENSYTFFMQPVATQLATIISPYDTFYTDSAVCAHARCLFAPCPDLASRDTFSAVWCSHARTCKTSPLLHL